MTEAISVRGLRKVYRTREMRGGLRGSLSQLFSPAVRELVALDGIDFSISRGERVAFIGPNGAGKSTTIKILSGILHPTSGEVRVAGLDPVTERRALGYQIGTVFGQRSQLWYHLPASDTFDLLATIYDQEPAVHARRRAELVEAFSLGPLLSKPVRQLSLGERMRCELVASLLHAPSVLFLDEPTIGLDVRAKAVVRDLVRDATREGSCTVLLTSHDTGDIEQVCDRVIVVHRGRLLIDASVAELRRTYIQSKILTVVTSGTEMHVDMPGVRPIATNGHREAHVMRFAVDTRTIAVAAVLERVLAQTQVRDLTVEDPPMEDIVSRIYASAEVEP